MLKTSMNKIHKIISVLPALLPVNRQKASNKKLTHIKSSLDDDDDKLYGGPRNFVSRSFQWFIELSFLN